MSGKITRRNFFGRSLGFCLGTILSRGFGLARSNTQGKIPLIITSHTNETGKKAIKAGWEILARGGSALDAVEKAANIIELDPEDMSVGFGGIPNEEGVIQLDASIMDGKTYSAGSVACLENIKTPSSVARIIMEHTDHVMLVGDDALKFAKKWGFKEENLLTEKARRVWLEWKQRISDRDDWGPPDHLKHLKKKLWGADEEQLKHLTGTTNVLAIDSKGDIAGVTTTSGLSFKIPGRVGDSPIIGAGLYVDNEVGAAGATGRGEDVIKSCATYFIVLRMKDGHSPQEACDDACRMIAEKYKKVNPNFLPGEKFVAINKKGEVGCSRTLGRRPARMSVMNEGGFTIQKGSVTFSRD